MTIVKSIEVNAIRPYFLKPIALHLAAPVLVCCVLSEAGIYAQNPPPARTASVSSSAEHAADLATQGRCAESLASFKKLNLNLLEKKVRYSSRMAIARCAMSLGEDQTTLDALMALRREFPKDPQVLYITTHFLSEMASRTSQELATVAPNSYQALELEAEAFESQGNWDRAELIYKKILSDNPNLPGIHYRLGRVAVARPDAPENNEQAKREFELELTIDPLNASAEFWLGELARRNGQWDAAIPHFEKAYQLDPGFAEAYLGLGATFVSAMRPQEAVAPLERYVKLVPADPAGHYQLSIAYGRTGRTADQQRELEIQQELNAKGPGSGAAPQQAPPK